MRRLLDEGARERFTEGALRQGDIDRVGIPGLTGIVAGLELQLQPRAPAQGCSVLSKLVVVSSVSSERGRASGSSGAGTRVRRSCAPGGRITSARASGEAVIVMRLVAQVEGPAGLDFRRPGEGDFRWRIGE